MNNSRIWNVLFGLTIAAMVGVVGYQVWLLDDSEPANDLLGGTWASYPLLGFFVLLLWQHGRNVAVVRKERGLAQAGVSEHKNANPRFTALGLLGEHVTNVERPTYYHPDSVSQEESLNLLRRRLAERDRLPALGVVVLPTAGLAFTMLGMMTGLSMMGDAINSMNPDEGVGGISAATESIGAMTRLTGEALRSIGMAYVTTLVAAVCGGIVLKLLTGLAVGEQGQLIAEIQSQTSAQVLPWLRQQAWCLYRDQQQQLTQQVVKDVVQNLPETVIQAVLRLPPGATDRVDVWSGNVLSLLEAIRISTETNRSQIIEEEDDDDEEEEDDESVVSPYDPFTD